MVHIPGYALLILIAVVAFFALGIGVMAERREAAKRLRKLEKQIVRETAKAERQEKWRKRKAALGEKLMLWRGRGDA